MSYSLRLSWGRFGLAKKWHFFAFVIGPTLKVWLSSRRFFLSFNGDFG